MANKPKLKIVMLKTKAQIIYSNQFGAGRENDDFVIDFNYASKAIDSAEIEIINGARIILREEIVQQLITGLSKLLGDYKKSKKRKNKLE